MEAAILGAQVIAFLMQPDRDGQHFGSLINLLCDYFQGKNGDGVTKGDMQTCKNLRTAFNDFVARKAVGKKIRGNSILVNVLQFYIAVMALTLSGNPDRNWLAIRSVLQEGPCERFRDIAQEVRNVRLLERGTVLRNGLSQDWRENGAYFNALDIIQQAFLREHFSTNSNPKRV